MIWNASYECMSREEMRACQNKRVSELIQRVYHTVPFYKNMMQRADLKPEDIQTVDDLRKMPFTIKQDLRDNYPFGLFAVPMSDIIRLHASSGTTGTPTTVGYTRKDLTNWSEITARSLSMAGITSHDVIQIAYGYGMFTGGLGIHDGAQKLGCTVIPISGGNTRRQLQLMADFGSTVLACTPSYALYIADAMKEYGYSLEQMKLRLGVFGAEPWTEAMREQLESKWHIIVHDIYGLSEIMGPGVACDCEYKDGLHIHEDHFYPEVVDPKTGEVLPDGEEGELVFTTLLKEGIPLVRYNTHDLSVLNHEKCRCGRTLVRMRKIKGRSDDMLIVRGVNLFPSQIEHVLLSLKATSPHYMLFVDRKNNLDTLELKVEVDESYFTDRIRELQSLGRRIEQALQSATGLNFKVTLVEPKSLERSDGKAKRVVDNRKF